MDPASPQPQVIYLVEPTTVTQNIRTAYAKTSATVLGWIHVLCGVVTFAADIPLILLPSYITMGVCDFGSGYFHYYHCFTGTWTSALFLVSGIVAILGARSGNKYLVLATIVVSIVSALGAGFLIVISSINLIGPYHHYLIPSFRWFDSTFTNYESYLNQTSEHTENFLNSMNNSDYPRYYSDCPPPQILSSFTMVQTEIRSVIEVSDAAFSIQILTGLVLLVCALASSILPCRPLCCPPRKSSGALNSLKFSLGEVTKVELVATGEESGKAEEGGDYHRFNNGKEALIMP